MRQSMGRKVVTGMGWTFSSSVTVRLMQFLVTVTLARLLAPSVFGLFALAQLVVTAITVFRDMGFGQALIYHKTDVRKNAETTFIISALFGVLAWIAIFAASPVVAKVFGNNELVWPLRVMSFSVVISSLATVPSILLEKELEFRKRAIPEFAMGISYAVVSIALALSGYAVWSLVIGHVASVLVQGIVTWLVAGWRPSISFHRESAERTFNYGKSLMAASVLFLAFFYVDNAAIGKWLGVTALGYYSLAFTICNLPATNITHVVNKVMYPAYAKLNDNMPALKSAYTQTVKSISLLTFPIALWLFIVSGSFVHGFFGPKWLPAIPLFRVLAIYGLFRSIGATAGSVFMAIGQPKWIYRLNFLQLAIVLPTVYFVAMAYGTFGVAVLFTVAYILGTSVALLKVIQLLEMTPREYIGMFRNSAFSSAVVVTISFLICKLLIKNYVGITIASGVMTLIAYPILAVRFDKETYRTARAIFKPSAEAPTNACAAAGSGE